MIGTRTRLPRRALGAAFGLILTAACGAAQTEGGGGNDDSAATAENPNGAHDTYMTYADLAAHETEGVDYTIAVDDRDAPVLVLAIHGGYIEVGTSELAKDIAEEPDFPQSNYYSFMGQKSQNNFELHITSRRFDEPRALDLANKSERCLSIHGFPNKNDCLICLGGLDEALKAEVTKELKALDLPFDLAIEVGGDRCGAFVGIEPANVVNRCKMQGAQLEMSSKFRNAFMADPLLRAKIAHALRNSVAVVSAAQ